MRKIRLFNIIKKGGFFMKISKKLKNVIILEGEKTNLNEFLKELLKEYKLLCVKTPKQLRIN